MSATSSTARLLYSMLLGAVLGIISSEYNWPILYLIAACVITIAPLNIILIMKEHRNEHS
jgi:hypothetical protein